jgi:hypothetical protein
MFAWLDRLLRATVDVRASPWAPLVLCQLLFGSLFGLAMGSLGPWDVNRLWYMAFAATKVPLLLLMALLLSLPCFYIMNALGGVHADFSRALRCILTAQASLTIVLASLAPFTLFWYASTNHYQAAILFNGLLFAVASVAAQLRLRTLYRPLIASNERHRLLLRLWLVVYVFVATQLAWVCRPFVGAPDTPAQFFRPESWGNAYVAIWNLLRSVVWRS